MTEDYIKPSPEFDAVLKENLKLIKKISSVRARLRFIANVSYFEAMPKLSLSQIQKASISALDELKDIPEE